MRLALVLLVFGVASCGSRPEPLRVVLAEGAVEAGPDWEWADLDGPDLVYAARGCLWRRRIEGPDRLGDPVCLADFTPMRFEAVAAPY